MSLVVCKLPKAGLGNQLFPLMHAAVFAKLNDLPLIVVGYHQMKIGPYIRNEKSKRNYQGFFKFEKNIFFESIDFLRIKLVSFGRKIVQEPQLEVVADQDDKTIYYFEKLPTYHDYFFHLKPHRRLVIELLYEMIADKFIQFLNKHTPADIGVHIRMGDFRKLKPGEEFKGGHVRTPESYFTHIISGIRLNTGNVDEVKVFTDGRYSEFEELFNLQKIKLEEGNPDIVDLLLLSKSKIIVISTGSTFSYWAGFLSEAPMIMHPDHIHSRIRPLGHMNTPFEGPFEDFLREKNN
jgi:hypothetical protein